MLRRLTVAHRPHHAQIMFQLTTLISPEALRRGGCPVYRTDQRAGQFIVTFPRAYHAGFNQARSPSAACSTAPAFADDDAAALQGFNIAEAVNFAPLHWLPVGRTCLDFYRQHGRKFVFSHEEMLCDVAEDSDRVDQEVRLRGWALWRARFDAVTL